MGHIIQKNITFIYKHQILWIFRRLFENEYSKGRIIIISIPYINYILIKLYGNHLEKSFIPLSKKKSSITEKVILLEDKYFHVNNFNDSLINAGMSSGDLLDTN